MLFVGDDRAEDHHELEIVDDTGRVLARGRLPEDLDGVTRLQRPQPVCPPRSPAAVGLDGDLCRMFGCSDVSRAVGPWHRLLDLVGRRPLTGVA